MAEKFEDPIKFIQLIQESARSNLRSGKVVPVQAREELTAELREEFAQRYEHDKGLIVEAVDGFIKERI